MSNAREGQAAAIEAWRAGQPVLEGPLAGVKVLEFAGLGPAPFAAMMLADMGASVLRVDRPGKAGAEGVLTRNRIGTVRLDLKAETGRDEALDLVGAADILLEGFRPLVMERLGLGPEPCLSRNPGLVYGRVTGWGQNGPLAPTAGHDINYIAVTGALDSIRGRDGTPVPPLNLVGDYGGGGMLVLAGVLAGIIERMRTGEGKVVDASMVDGAALLLASVWTARAEGTWKDVPGTNRIDGGAPFYGVYATSDGQHMAVGCIEPQFYALLLEGLGLSAEELPDQNDRAQWPILRQAIADRFASRTREEWSRVFGLSDACVTPVLTLAESVEHPQIRARGTLSVRPATALGQTGIIEPAPAPRFLSAEQISASLESEGAR